MQTQKPANTQKKFDSKYGHTPRAQTSCKQQLTPARQLSHAAGSFQHPLVQICLFFVQISPRSVVSCVSEISGIRGMSARFLFFPSACAEVVTRDMRVRHRLTDMLNDEKDTWHECCVDNLPPRACVAYKEQNVTRCARYTQGLTSLGHMTQASHYCERQQTCEHQQHVNFTHSIEQNSGINSH